MTLPITGVSELVLEVSDLEAAERFYSGALGLPVVERWFEREAIWLMAGERTRIGLWRPQVGVAGGRGGEHVHFALHLPDPEFDAAVARLREYGLKPEVQVCRRLRRASRSAYVDDPDGNCVELWSQDVSEYLRRARAAPPSVDESLSAEHFDATAVDWDASYEKHTVRGQRKRSRMAAAVRLVGEGPGSLLEMGVGSGRLLAELSARGWTVTGVDPAPGMVEIARMRVPAAAERLTVARAEELPFADRGFDVVVAIGVLEYTDMNRSLGELARVLRPGGRAVIGLRNGRAPVAAWRRAVMHPLARAIKGVVSFGGSLPKRRRSPLSLASVHRLLNPAGLAVEHAENVCCELLPDPIDRLAPRLAYRATRRVEHLRLARKLLGTQRLIVARRA
jgi:SAM-dependent methyltransferase/catechol 2,3-dioxygenase-like lactoylglutathione lyase family enzyme